jgi:hypothetical protein
MRVGIKVRLSYEIPCLRLHTFALAVLLRARRLIFLVPLHDLPFLRKSEDFAFGGENIFAIFLADRAAF